MENGTSFKTTKNNPNMNKLDYFDKFTSWSNDIIKIDNV